MKKRNLLLISALTSAMLILIFSVTYALPIVNIDTFDADTQSHEINGGIGAVAPTCATPFTGGTDMAGGVRDMNLERVSGSGVVKVEVNQAVAPNALAFSVDAGTVGNVILQWDATAGCILTPTGLGGLNLDPNDGLFVFVEQADQGTSVKMRIYTTATDYSFLDYTVPYAIVSPGHLAFFPFDTFTPVNAGATFGNVGSVEVEIEGSALDIIFDVIASDFARDYGDLPVSYGITNSGADNGARHIVGGIHFGTTVDSELNGQEGLTATGDDLNRGNDDDGITINTGSDWGDGNGTLNLVVQAPLGVTSCVIGWIDWNNNGVFEGVTVDGRNERVINASGIPAGTYNNFVITTPRDAARGGVDYPASLNARFRVFAETDPLFTTLGLTLDAALGTQGCPAASNSDAALLGLLTGEGLDGEVEDYQWGFTPTAVSLQNVSANSADTVPAVGIIAFALLAIIGTGVALTRRQQA